MLNHTSYREYHLVSIHKKKKKKKKKIDGKRTT